MFAFQFLLCRHEGRSIRSARVQSQEHLPLVLCNDSFLGHAYQGTFLLVHTVTLSTKFGHTPFKAAFWGLLESLTPQMRLFRLSWTVSGGSSPAHSPSRRNQNLFRTSFGKTKTAMATPSRNRNDSPVPTRNGTIFLSFACLLTAFNERRVRRQCRCRGRQQSHRVYTAHLGPKPGCSMSSFRSHTWVWLASSQGAPP